MKRWLFSLTGGRPMVCEDHAFVDVISGKDVFYWRDRNGVRWLANGAWSLFRVKSRSQS